MGESDLRITDIWFRSPLSLSKLGTEIGLADFELDAENYWEWIIGDLDGVRVNISRTHRKRRASTDTRITIEKEADPLVGVTAFSSEQKQIVIAHLRRVVISPVMCGQWRYLGGNDFELRAFETLHTT